MGWILLATFGQFLNAIVAILDKYIVSDEKVLPRPFVYAFYSCLLTGFWAVIYVFGYIPFLAGYGMPTLQNVTFPSLPVVAMSFLSAYTFFIALVSMYEALRKSDASTVMPIIGTVSALATFGLSFIFLDAQLTMAHGVGIVVLALGTLMVAQSLPKMSAVLHVVHAGLFFALHYITMKGLFDMTSFDDGFFWSRMSFVLFALSLLLVPVYLEKIRSQSKTTTKKTGFIIITTKIIAGIAAFLILKATDLGEVAVVQALDGLRYIFILIITMLFVHWLPHSAADKDTRPATFFRKFLYIILITIGFIIIFSDDLL